MNDHIYNDEQRLVNVDVEKFVSNPNTKMGRLIWNAAIDKAAKNADDKGYIIIADQIRELKK